MDSRFASELSRVNPLEAFSFAGDVSTIPFLSPFPCDSEFTALPDFGQSHRIQPSEGESAGIPWASWNLQHFLAAS